MPTTREALQAADVLRRYIEGIDRMFGQVQSVGLAASTETALPITATGGEPPSWAARVLAILTDDGGYMSPKEIVADYRRRGWKEIPKTENRIHATLGQLKVSEKVDHNMEARKYKIMN